MLDFSFYCDLKNHIDSIYGDNISKVPDKKVNELTKRENLKRKIIESGFRKRRLFTDAKEDINSDDSKFISYIYECDKETVLSLMDFFEKDASIQIYLQKRLSELENGQLSKRANDSFSNPFFKKLDEFMTKKGYCKDSDFYNYADIPRQTFNKLKNGRIAVQRHHLFHFISALELNYEEADELAKSAGYALTAGDRREAIVSYVIRNRKYTFSEMNEILYMMNEKTFGGLEY